MPNRFSHSEYLEKLEEVHGGDIVPLEDYITIKTPIKHKCYRHDYIWEVSPASLLAGRGCTECGNEKRRNILSKSHEEYINDLKEVHGDDIIPLEDYYNTDARTKHKCRVCGYIWHPRPAHLLKGKGCPQCAGNVKRTHQNYLEDLKEVHDGNIIPVEKYDWVQVKIKHKCNLCGHEWGVSPHQLLNGNEGCPRCRISKGEKLVDKILVRENVSFEPQYKFDDCKDKRPLPFDFAIIAHDKPEGLIEYQGRQHYMNIGAFGDREAYKTRIEHDIIKSKFANDNDIPLLKVNYLDKRYDRVERKVKDLLERG